MQQSQNNGERLTFQNNFQQNSTEENFNFLNDLSIHSEIPFGQNMEAFNNPFQNQDKINFADDDNILQQNQKNQDELQDFMQKFAQFNIQNETIGENKQQTEQLNEKKIPQLKVQTKFQEQSPAFFKQEIGTEEENKQASGKHLDITVNASFGVDENQSKVFQIYDDINQLKEKVVVILQQYNTKMQSKEAVQGQEIRQDVQNVQQQYNQMLNKYSTINQTQLDYTIQNPQQSFMNSSYLKTGGPKEGNINQMISLVEDFLGQFTNQQQQQNIIKDPNDYDVVCIYCSQKIPYLQLQQHTEICKQQYNRANQILPSLTQQRNSIITSSQTINMEKLAKICEKIKLKANKLNDNPLAQPIYSLMTIILNTKQNNQTLDIQDYIIRVKNFINKINQQYQLAQFLSNAEISLLALLNKLYNFLAFPSSDENTNLDEITNSSDKSGQKMRNQILKQNSLMLKTKVPIDENKLEFYSLVIETKKSTQQMKKFCLISKMYEQILENKLLKDSWKGFVEQQLVIQ